ncbi:MAG: hypothetical protein R2731_01465 [Nocardioides sp.]
MSPRTLITNPMAQFLAVGFVMVTALVIGTTVLSARAARQEALNDASATTQVLAHSVAQPAIRPGLVDGSAGAIDRF